MPLLMHVNRAPNVALNSKNEGVYVQFSPALNSVMYQYANKLEHVFFEIFV